MSAATSEATETTWSSDEPDVRFRDKARALLKGHESGHLWPYIYDTARFAGDRVDGAHLYRLFQSEAHYYLYEEEARLIAERRADIAACVRDPAASIVVEVGAGSALSVRRKTVPLLTPLVRSGLRSYLSADISMSFVVEGLAVVRSHFPGLRAAGLCADFVHSDLSLDFGDAAPVLCFLGSTIANMTEDECQGFLLRVRRALGSRGSLVIGYDTNQDEAALLRAYENQSTANLVANIMWKIRRDCGAPEMQADAFEYRIRWVPESFDLQHCVVATRPQRFYFMGEELRIAAGQEFHIMSSRKYSTAHFTALAQSTGFADTRVLRSAAGRMVIHVLRAV